MLHDIKVDIYKRQPVNKKGSLRSAYYSAYGKGTKPPRIWIETCEFRTEREMVRWIYENYGAGEYRLSAMAKGRKGIWVFWKGLINERGFVFYQKKYNRKEVIEWNKDIREAESREEKEIYENLKQEIIKEEKDKNKGRRYGFEPWIKISSRRGEFRLWASYDLGNFQPKNFGNNNEWDIKKKIVLPKWNKSTMKVLEKW